MENGLSELTHMSREHITCYTKRRREISLGSGIFRCPTGKELNASTTLRTSRVLGSSDVLFTIGTFLYCQRGRPILIRSIKKITANVFGRNSLRSKGVLKTIVYFLPFFINSSKTSLKPLCSADHLER